MSQTLNTTTASMSSLEVPVPHHPGAPLATAHFTWAGSAADPSRSPSVSNEHVRGAPPPGVASGSGPAYHSADNEDTLAELVAKYGNASSLAWLDAERYKIWRSSQPIPESTFTPVQGYFQRGTCSAFLLPISLAPPHYAL